MPVIPSIPTAQPAREDTHIRLNEYSIYIYQITLYLKYTILLFAALFSGLYLSTSNTDPLVLDIDTTIRITLSQIIIKNTQCYSSLVLTLELGEQFD
jgi:hypothetical protein